MINEIVRFMDMIPEDYAIDNVRPSEGLHILVMLDEQGNLEDKKTYWITKKNDRSDEWQELLQREQYAGLISMNKSLDSKKKIHSCHVFSLLFKRDATEEAIKRIQDFSAKGKRYITDAQLDNMNGFHTWCQNHLWSHLEPENLYQKKDGKYIEKDCYIKVHLLNASIEECAALQQQYIEDSIFLKEDYTLKAGEYDIGLTGFLNGLNDGKVFLKHHTAPFLVNGRHSRSVAKTLFEFEKLLKTKTSNGQKKLPNPLPIFIDKEELNEEAIGFYKREGGVSRYQEIIKELCDKHQEDIGNYYLIFWQNTKDGIVIRDVDFVSSFRYSMGDMVVSKIIRALPTSSDDKRISTIFDFERIVVKTLFANQLVSYIKKSDGWMYKYFDDIEFNSDYMTRATFHNMMKYRKAMYDFVYKSKREVLTAHMLYSIVMSECYDRIRTNVDRDKALSTGYLVVDLLNTLFSLHSYFGGNLMPSMITKQREHIRSVLHDEQILSGDENFAYAAGQLIYYILEKSKSENKTHAMLEPFLNKREMQLFRLAITRSIEQYKHAFDWYGKSGKGRFEILAAQVLSYNAETRIEDLHPHLLAGYFDTSLIYEKKQDSTNNSQTNISEGE